MAETQPASYQVAIVGAGPIGLTLANLLGTYGIKTLLIERHTTTVQEPRAVSIDDEALRTMQACGMIEPVEQSIVAGYGSEYYGPDGKRFLTVRPTGSPYGFPRRNAFRQPILEAQLDEGLARFSQVTRRFGCDLVGFHDHGDKVSLEIETETGTRETTTADYLVGCDGATSFVRSHLGLVLEGETFKERWLIVDLEDAPCASRETLVFCDPARPCIALPGPNNTRRFEFKLLPGDSSEKMAALDNVEALIALPIYGVPPQRKIARHVVYAFHARLALRWSKGRVFLAGDACHLTPPFAGQGMNSGIRDAHNLAWKLAFVLRGQLTARLLETYETERHDHVRAMIELALRMGRIMGPRSSFDGFLTRSWFKLLNVWPNARAYFAEMKYKPAPRFSRGFLVPDGMSKRNTIVGKLLPQPWVTGTGGETMLLDHYLGNGFALLAIDADSKLFKTFSAQAPLDRFGAKNLLVGDDLGEEAEGAVRVADRHAILRGLAGNKPNQVLLIRPDRYVAASFDLSKPDETSQRLGALKQLG